MLAHGNGKPEQCAQNLLSMARGECPYERCKGLDPDLLDRPPSEAAGILAEDVAWIFDNYEPRISRKAISLALNALSRGDGVIAAELEVTEV